MMQIPPSALQKADLTAAIDSQLITAHMGWQIFLSRIFREQTDKGLWLHWYHPADQNRRYAVRYGYFIAPDQTLEAALHAVYQSIEAIVELESMDYPWSAVPAEDDAGGDWEVLSVQT